MPASLGFSCKNVQTDPGDIAKIREAVKEKKEACLCLVNYKADGSTFHNQFSLTPLFDADGNLVSLRVSVFLVALVIGFDCAEVGRDVNVEGPSQRIGRTS